MARIFYNSNLVITAIALLVFLPFVSFSQVKTPKNNTAAGTITAPLVVPDTSKNGLLVPVVVRDTDKNSNVQYFTLKQCIDYALIHQPKLNISLINIEVTKTNNAIDLAGLLPQASASGSLTHYFQEGNSSAINSSNGAVTSRSSYPNIFTPGVAVSQSIFNPSLLYAYRSAPLYVKQSQQVTDSTKIYLVSAVSKSFYNLLNTLEQINVFKEDTARLGKSLRDAYHQYKGGIVDETDYEQADITLNNSKVQLKQATENVVPQYATLKQLIGFPPEKQFNVVFDTLEMMNGIHVDTTEQLRYEKRIEFQQLNTSKALQQQLVNYYRYSWAPTLSAFFNYNLTFANSNYDKLFSSSYPTSDVGLSVSIPIFTGFARLNNLKKAKLQQQIITWNETDLKSAINVQYTSALANYKGNYYNLLLSQRNVALARRVYFVVDLQYKQGIVAYLNVITAESNLITSEINYLNALFQVLSNKIDLQKAMGNISY